MSNREHLYEIIADNIKKERKKLCISQGQLAERADVSIDTVKSVEHDKTFKNLYFYSNNDTLYMSNEI